MRCCEDPGGADTRERPQWYLGPCINTRQWNKAPGERAGKDWSPLCRAWGARIPRKDPAPKLPMYPVTFP